MGRTDETKSEFDGAKERALYLWALELALSGLETATAAVRSHRRALSSYLKRFGVVHPAVTRAVDSGSIDGIGLDSLMGNTQHLNLLAENLKDSLSIAQGRAMMLRNAIERGQKAQVGVWVKKTIREFSSEVHDHELWAEAQRIAVRSGVSEDVLS